MNSDAILYKGMTRAQIEAIYDDALSIPNFYELLQENREKAKLIKDELKPVSDVSYGNEEIQKLDIYAPHHAKDFPVLIDIHGGGWVAGSKNARSIPAKTLLSKGLIWVPIDYGLAPRYSMKNIIEHVRAALSWVHHHIQKYGGDPNRIYVTGQSAGAHLAATMLMSGWHQSFSLPEDLIKGFILLSGVYDLNSMLYLPEIEPQSLLQLSFEEAALFSPFHNLLEKNIPVVIAYGDQEPFAYCREALEYHELLKQKSFSTHLISIPNANHVHTMNEIANINGEVFKLMMEIIFD